VEALAALVDELSRRAAPASVSTIRLTSAYLRVAVEGGEPPEPVVARARRLKRMMSLIVVAASVATVLSVLLLAHVDDGRRAMQQLGAVRAEIAALDGDLAKLPPGDWAERRGGAGGAAAAAGPQEGRAPFLPFCAPRWNARFEAQSGEAPGAARPPVALAAWREPASAASQSLCARRDQLLLREDLVFMRLADWNCRTSNVPTPWRMVWPAEGAERCGTPAVPLPDTVRPEWWQRTEVRAAASISVLTGFVLPLLLGCVGGCAYALRRLDQKLSDWTLEVRDGSHSLLRVLLATMLGGLLGVVWSGDQPVQLGGFALTLAAAAFFVGFALEVVFTVIEAMVDGVAGKLRAPAPPPPPLVVPQQQAFAPQPFVVQPAATQPVVGQQTVAAPPPVAANSRG
jgi:hypothetical protein